MVFRKDKEFKMNKIISQIEKIMLECMNTQMPDISKKDLEKDGAIFYMNGKNGTAFDWYVNDHFPAFFIFYGDKENLGAVKALLYTDGFLDVYVYGDQGHGEPKNMGFEIDAEDKEFLNLAVLLTKNADDKLIWDEDIKSIDCEEVPDDSSIEEFLSLKEAHAHMRKIKDMLGQTVIVSKKVREEGWKIGYGIRFEPTHEGDSGWCFSVGNETDEYINNPDNLELWVVNSVLMTEPALNEFITAPFDTAIVRVSSEKFELDEPGKEIFIEKAVEKV